MELKLRHGANSLILTVSDGSTFEDLLQTYLREKKDLMKETVTFVIRGKRYKPGASSADSGTRLLDAGLKNGVSLMVLGHPAKDVEATLATAKDDPTLLGIEEEHARNAQRIRQSRRVEVPSGKYTFQQYHALTTEELPGAFPAASRALELLHRLAGDPGIVHIMRENQFKVGRLSEMPPTDFMDDTRAVTCLLGLNINKGQEIKLRLRTNDLKGFRNYNKIRETLVHELTHNVWGDHDNNFKELNSKLLRECIRINRSRAVFGPVDVREADVPPELDEPVSRTLGGVKSSISPQMAAAAAAARRMASASTSGSVPWQRVSRVADGDGHEDVTTAFERQDGEVDQEEQQLAAWGSDCRQEQK